ncbi:MAG: hypothetical protein O7D32_04015, partial [bacterium]|nr:hypothetical protein [bacterium]
REWGTNQERIYQMGDRCYMEIECSKVDYDAVLHDYFAEILEEDEYISTYPLDIKAENVTIVKVEEVFEG